MTVYTQTMSKTKKSGERHPLHKATRALIERLVGNKGRSIFDDAADGVQRLPLFLKPEATRENYLCCVDGLVIRDDSVCLLIEVDESNIRPTHLAGKFLTSASARSFIHRKREDHINLRPKSVTFLQVTSSKSIRKRSKKCDQLRELEKRLRELTPIGTVSQYHLVVCKPHELCGETLARGRIARIVSEVLSDNNA